MTKELPAHNRSRRGQGRARGAVRSILIVSACLFVGLGMRSLPRAVHAQEHTTYRFGYSSSQNPAILIDRMSPLLEILSDALDAEIEFVHKSSFSEMQQAYINQEIDFGIINAYSFLRILPYDSVLPVAARVIEGSKEYRTYFFTRADSAIASIPDLLNRKIVLGDPYSTSSYLIPHHFFRRYGIHPDTDFAKTIIITKQDSLIVAVLNRTADAGACASFIFNDQPHAIRSRLRVFDMSQPFPLGPFIANKNLPDDTITTIRDVLLALNEHPEGRAALEEAGMEGFEPVDAADYQPLLDIVEELSLN